jgi:serine/threonine protein kinase
MNKFNLVYVLKIIYNEGIVYVFIEYCPNGDLRSWLRNNSRNYTNANDSKTSMLNGLRKSLQASRPQSTKQFDSTDNLIEENGIDFKKINFNNQDLLFFCYQIAKGI